MDEGNSSDTSDFLDDKIPSTYKHHNDIPKPPPLPMKKANRALPKYCRVPTATKDVWEKLFKEGHGADVHIITGDGSIIAAHQCILVSISCLIFLFHMTCHFLY